MNVNRREIPACGVELMDIEVWTANLANRIVDLCRRGLIFALESRKTSIKVEVRSCICSLHRERFVTCVERAMAMLEAEDIRASLSGPSTARHTPEAGDWFSEHTDELYEFTLQVK